MSDLNETVFKGIQEIAKTLEIKDEQMSKIVEHVSGNIKSLNEQIKEEQFNSTKDVLSKNIDSLSLSGGLKDYLKSNLSKDNVALIKELAGLKAEAEPVSKEVITPVVGEAKKPEIKTFIPNNVGAPSASGAKAELDQKLSDPEFSFKYRNRVKGHEEAFAEVERLKEVIRNS